MSVPSYQGHIPSLERPISKTGFIASCSSHHGLHPAWLAFNNGQGEWASNAEGAGACIQIICPQPVRIWKIRLTRRTSNIERITSWKFSGGNEEDNLTDLYASQLFWDL